MPIIDIVGILGLIVAIGVYMQNLRLEKKISNSMATFAATSKNVGAVVDQFAKFKVMFDYALDAILIADADGKVLYANKGFQRITGFTKQEILGSKAGVLWGGQMDKDFYARLWKVIKTDKQAFSTTITNKRKNGQQYKSKVNIIPMLDDAKEQVEYFVAIEHEVE